MHIATKVESLFQNGSRDCSFSSMQKTKVKEIRANLHLPVPFYSLGGRRTERCGESGPNCGVCKTFPLCFMPAEGDVQLGKGA